MKLVIVCEASLFSFYRLKGKNECKHKIDIAGSVSFDYCNSETIPSDSKLALISFNVSLFARMGKQSVIQYPRETVSQSVSPSLQKWTCIHLEEMRDRFVAPRNDLYCARFQ